MSADIEAETPAAGTAAEKIAQTLRDLSRPGEDAGELELTLATVAMGLERGLGEQLAQSQASGELDEFVLALTRWISLHRSDSSHELIVVELPRRPIRSDGSRRELPSGTRLHLLEQAIEATQQATSPL
jgi:hypothetical protein